ncbi:MAG TPA: glycosyltransferase N-terminal domain-containing protein [Candidatus Kapabacteria bacterium]|nr:glycosyltransferase N-terminal domain-containing protein [Candidatus Kapabacteria bacterium]
MWPFLYRSVIGPAVAIIGRIVAFGSPKVRQTLAGRRAWREQLALLPPREPGVRRVHVHAASVGEFEQAKPIIEALRAEGNRMVITASFFSSSGFEQQRGYAHVDAVSYLPSDSARAMRDFLDLIDPDLILILRYDLWPCFMLEARRRSVPVALVSGVLRRNSARFRPLLRGFFAWLYGQLRHIYAVTYADRDAFVSLAPYVPVEVGGDTRYDRVLMRLDAAAPVPALEESITRGRAVLVAGSTWLPDEELLAGVDRSALLMVVVPHEPTPEHVARLLEQFPNSCTLSALEQRAFSAGDAVDTIVVDRMGILFGLYGLGTFAYVGGGFGEGVHSVLEPAAYGLPVFCGPKTERSRDAQEMRSEGLLTVTRSARDLAAGLDLLLANPTLLEQRRSECAGFVRRHQGATQRIIASLRRNRLL